MPRGETQTPNPQGEGKKGIFSKFFKEKEEAENEPLSEEGYQAKTAEIRKRWEAKKKGGQKAEASKKAESQQGETKEERIAREKVESIVDEYERKFEGKELYRGFRTFSDMSPEESAVMLEEILKEHQANMARIDEEIMKTEEEETIELTTDGIADAYDEELGLEDMVLESSNKVEDILAVTFENKNLSEQDKQNEVKLIIVSFDGAIKNERDLRGGKLTLSEQAEIADKVADQYHGIMEKIKNERLLNKEIPKEELSSWQKIYDAASRHEDKYSKVTEDAKTKLKREKTISEIEAGIESDLQEIEGGTLVLSETETPSPLETPVVTKEILQAELDQAFASLDQKSLAAREMAANRTMVEAKPEEVYRAGALEWMNQREQALEWAKFFEQAGEESPKAAEYRKLARNLEVNMYSLINKEAIAMYEGVDAERKKSFMESAKQRISDFSLAALRVHEGTKNVLRTGLPDEKKKFYLAENLQELDKYYREIADMNQNPLGGENGEIQMLTESASMAIVDQIADLQIEQSLFEAREEVEAESGDDLEDMVTLQKERPAEIPLEKKVEILRQNQIEAGEKDRIVETRKELERNELLASEMDSVLKQLGFNEAWASKNVLLEVYNSLKIDETLRLGFHKETTFFGNVKDRYIEQGFLDSLSKLIEANLIDEHVKDAILHGSDIANKKRYAKEVNRRRMTQAEKEEMLSYPAEGISNKLIEGLRKLKETNKKRADEYKALREQYNAKVRNQIQAGIENPPSLIAY